MYRSRASLILVAALLSGCNAAFTAADTSQASAQPAVAPQSLAPAADASASADRVAATGNAQREGVQLEAQDLDSVMWVVDAHSAAPAKTASHASDGKHASVRLTAKDLDSLL